MSDPSVTYIDISLVGDNVPSFHRVIVELKSTLTTQVEPIAVSFTSGVISAGIVPPSPSCPGPSCPSGKSEEYSLRYLIVILFTILVIIILILVCRRPTPPRRGESPYGRHRSPYPDETRSPMTSFATPYPYSSDVSPSRRRQSPNLGRRGTPGSSPRGLFSVTQ